ncbi:MAG: hypothetical protein IEMM0008_0699 [bacterium]|nr:MAG: hypothetical protein IEMM0008_0699 [bacterium]
MYQVILTQRALKDLNAMNQHLQDRIVGKLNDYVEDPLKYAKKLSNTKMGDYRFKIGDYRAIFDINDEEIVILRIGHRKDIYK